MNKQIFSAHNIVDINNIGFSATDYSKFKYGSGKVARDFGFSVCSAFVEKYNEFCFSKQIVLVSSPYSFIPPASDKLSYYFVQLFNIFLIEKGYSPIQQLKIYRKNTYVYDYGNMSTEERKLFLLNDSFYIDLEYIKNKTIFFIDDIRVTGLHEEVVNKLVVGDEYIFNIYFASVSNNIDPNFEGILNNNYINTLKGIDYLIEHENFFLNARNVKFILRQEGCFDFLKCKPIEFIMDFYNHSIGDNYHKINEFSEKLLKIKQKLL